MDLLTMKGIVNRCGRGSHTEPNWSGPGVRESKTRRAMLICATASPDRRISFREWKKDNAAIATRLRKPVRIQYSLASTRTFQSARAPDTAGTVAKPAGLSDVGEFTEDLVARINLLACE